MPVGDFSFLATEAVYQIRYIRTSSFCGDLSSSRQYRKELLSNIIAIQNLDLSDHAVNDIEYQHPLGRGQCHIPVTGP
jgi:hypothetical protein